MNITRRIEQHPIEIARGTFWRHPHIPAALFSFPKELGAWLRVQGVTEICQFVHDDCDHQAYRASGLIPIQVKHANYGGYEHVWVKREQEAV